MGNGMSDQDLPEWQIGLKQMDVVDYFLFALQH